MWGLDNLFGRNKIKNPAKYIEIKKCVVNKMIMKDNFKDCLFEDYRRIQRGELYKELYNCSLCKMNKLSLDEKQFVR